MSTAVATVFKGFIPVERAETKEIKLTQMKQFESMLPANEVLLSSFRDSKYPQWKIDEKHRSSWLQYKSRVGNFLDSLNKSVFEATANDITAYLQSKPNAKNFINGFLLYHLKENTDNCRNTIDREVLIHLLNLN